MSTITLAIDTCSRACSVAVRLADQTVRSRSEEIGVGHAEHLPPMIGGLLDECGVGAHDIGAVIATTGPGSFMGVRVGISFAKGLVAAGRATGYGLSSLEALWLSAPAGARGLALVDARRGEAYLRCFNRPGPDEPTLMPVDTIGSLDIDPERDVLVGQGAYPLAGLPEPSKPIEYPDVERLVQMPSSSLGPLEPAYLRAPDAAPAKRLER